MSECVCVRACMHVCPSVSMCICLLEAELNYSSIYIDKIEVGLE